MITGNTVMHEAHYPHPPERVWRALVDPAELALWRRIRRRRRPALHDDL